ncbi:MAG: hypothetical protein FWG25_11085 [Promicromonosporaceae bacterium]|nr:hypothetical protein [Promicromonosporaceae bacterium]
MAVDTLELDRLAIPSGLSTPYELELIGDWQPLASGATAAAFTFGQYGTWSGFGSGDEGEWLGVEPVVSTSSTTGVRSTTEPVVSTGSTTGYEWTGTWELDYEGNFRAYSNTPLLVEPVLDESPWCPIEEPLTGSWLLDARYLGIGECTRSERRLIGAMPDDECETLVFFGADGTELMRLYRVVEPEITGLDINDDADWDTDLVIDLDTGFDNVSEEGPDVREYPSSSSSSPTETKPGLTKKTDTENLFVPDTEADEFPDPWAAKD